jgi:NADPH-dependent ferric siderophore reductase
VSTNPASRISTRRFRVGLISTISVLALACAGLATASVLQGPRIQGAQVNVAQAVVAPTALRVVFDEAVAPVAAADVSVTPRVPVTVQNDRDVVLVTFGAALRYDTTYTVTIAGVRAAAGGVQVDVSHRIRTPAFQPTWLQRAPSGDRILTATPGGDQVTLFTGARIQDYLVLDSAAVLVLTLDDSGATEASIVATDGSGNAEQLTLPGDAPGRIDVLERVGTDVLYTFSSLDDDSSSDLPVFDDTLFRLDLSGTHISDEVAGLDGKPLSVDGVIPVPGGTDAFVHTRSEDVLRYQPTGSDPPTLVAKYQELTALTGDGRLSVKDAFGWLAYSLADGSESRLEPAPLASGETPFVADVIPLSDGRQIERAVVPKGDYSAFDSFIAIDDGSRSAPLYRMPDGGGSIIDYSVTPNGQYLVAEVSPGGDSFESSDGYATGDRPRDVQTIVIDVGSGEVAAQWPGSHPRW